MDIFSALTEELRRECPGMELREYEPMAQHTTFRIGGPARVMALPGSVEEAAAAVRTARNMGICPIFMGNGSNLLVPDEGVEAFVVKAADGLSRITLTGECEITAESGARLVRLAQFAQEHGLTGLEFAHGIPGSVGGAVTMNAGAYGGEMRQVVVETLLLNEAGEVESVCGEEQGFSYRHSAFSDGSRMILAARYRLEKGHSAAIRARMDALMEQRRAKQPLEYPSAGSTFKRPEGCFAAALIDRCGLKGACVGGAQVSEKHAGFLINRGGASYADVMGLVELVRRTVREQTGVELELEVKVLAGGAGDRQTKG